MTTAPTPTSGAADLPAMVSKSLREAYNLGMMYWQQADSEYISQHKKADDTRAKFLALVEETCAALAAGQATAAQAGAPANMRLCYSCGHPADAHPWVNDPRGGKRRGDCPAAPAQPVAQQGVAYAALPEPYCNAHDDAGACYPDMFSEYQMRAFADATHTLRASHGQAPAGAGERVYAFRRKGLADFCTCDEARYEELSNKPNLFETRVFYTAPQPVAREPLDEARRMFDAGWKAAALFCDREDVVADGIIGFGACPQFEAAFSAAHDLKGGQHGTE